MKRNLLQLIYEHYMATRSRRAYDLLNNWPEERGKFIKVFPVEYRACPGHAFLKEACSSFLLFGVRQGPPRVRRPPFFQRPARCFMAGHLEANIPEKEVFMTVLSVDKEMRLHGWG